MAAGDDSNAAPEETREGVKTLEKWLNKSMKIIMTDGRVLFGIFLCTDKDCNVILGSCQEYLKSPDLNDKEEARVLGLAMVPGQHIISIEIDEDHKAMVIPPCEPMHSVIS